MPNPAIETVRFEDDVAREILAGGDIGSLPHDYPLDRMAADRMKELAEARDRIVELEAENTALKRRLDVEVTAKRAALAALTQ